MSDLLFVQSSPRGSESESVAIAEAFLEGYRDARPEAEVDVLDLWREPVPAFAGDHVAAKMTVIAGRTPAGRQATAWDEILAFASRFTAARDFLFTSPMWNHNVPWVLKRFIDTVTQPGVTFGFDAEHGYVGLLEGKRAAVIRASGVWPRFGEGGATAYLEEWLRFVGVDEIHTVEVAASLLDPDLDTARSRARAEARELGARLARSVPALR